MFSCFFSKRASLTAIIPLVMCLTLEANQTKNFDKIWAAAKSQIAPKIKSKSFTEKSRLELRQRVKATKTAEELAAILNPFLVSLNISHTFLYHINNPDYFLMRSLFTTKNPNEPKIYHVGMQVQELRGHYVVRNVLEGYPAQKAGVQRGDIIETVNGQPFHPLKSFSEKSRPYKTTILRNEKLLNFSFETVYEGIQASLIEATKKSVRIFEKNNKKIGYIHLWSGTDDGFLSALKDALSNQLKETDSLILDLRDGFGGAWWDYLDPFYPDSKNYFVATKIARDGSRTEMRADLYSNQNPYKKPMVVLINEGVRSGKEAISYHLQKTKRAILVGTPTAGAFVGGKAIFADEKSDYLLYLSTFEMLLDGEQIEGVSVKPDILVENSINESLKEDPQLLKALEIAGMK